MKNIVFENQHKYYNLHTNLASCPGDYYAIYSGRHHPVHTHTYTHSQTPPKYIEIQDQNQLEPKGLAALTVCLQDMLIQNIW